MDSAIVLTVAKTVSYVAITIAAISLLRHLVVKLFARAGLRVDSTRIGFLTSLMILGSLTLCGISGAEGTFGLFGADNISNPDVLSVKVVMLLALVVVVVIIHTVVRPWIKEDSEGDFADRLTWLRSVTLSFCMALLLTLLSHWPVAAFTGEAGMGRPIIAGLVAVFMMLWLLFALGLLISALLSQYELAGSEELYEEEAPPFRRGHAEPPARVSERRNLYL